MRSDTEQLLRDAMRIAVSRGWKIRSEITVSLLSKCCCPLGAVCIAAEEDLESNSLLELGAAKVGFSHQERVDFVQGFDYNFLPKNPPDAWTLGQKLRQEFL